MAENEMLDVGNRFHYRRWRRLIADSNCSPVEAGECLVQEFFLIFRKKLRGEPLSVILKACGEDRKALQEAVENFKDRALAKLVEQANTITRSRDPQIVAVKIAELLIDGLLNKASLYTFRTIHGADRVKHEALEQAAIAKLEKCRPEIVRSLMASLSGEKRRHARVKREQRPTTGSMVMTSLLSSTNKQSRELPHV